MKLPKKPLSDKTHVFVRKLADGRPRVYNYKLFQVKRADGRSTTVSMSPIEYVSTLAQSRVNARQFSQAVKEAAAAVPLPLRKGITFTAATLGRAPAALKAKRLGVTVEDLQHAEANNAAWQ
jgi:hypothetical protein